VGSILGCQEFLSLLLIGRIYAEVHLKGEKADINVATASYN
jgi:hypothetical protein